VTALEAAKVLMSRLDYLTAALLGEGVVPTWVTSLADEVAQLRKALAEPVIVLTPQVAESMLDLALLTDLSDRTPEEQAAVDYTAYSLAVVQGVQP